MMDCGRCCGGVLGECAGSGENQRRSSTNRDAIALILLLVSNTEPETRFLRFRFPSDIAWSLATVICDKRSDLVPHISRVCSRAFARKFLSRFLSHFSFRAGSHELSSRHGYVF